MADVVGSAPDDSFCLKWDEFSTNLNASFKSLRSKGDFFDVSLMTQEGELLAHKVILSAGSPFFRSIFKKNEQRQACSGSTSLLTIYMMGMSYQNLSNVLDFIYEGEVNVLQHQLNDFLTVAQELQVKGLTNKLDSKTPPGSHQFSDPDTAAQTPSATKWPSAATSAFSSKNAKAGSSSVSSVSSHKRCGSQTTVSGKRIKQEADTDLPMETLLVTQDVELPTIAEEDDDYEGDDYEDDSQDQSQGPAEGGGRDLSILINLPNGQCRCQECNRLFACRGNALIHFERVHEEPQCFECCLCHKVIRNKFAFRTHIRLTHDIRGTKILESYGKLVNP